MVMAVNKFFSKIILIKGMEVEFLVRGMVRGNGTTVVVIIVVMVRAIGP